MSYSGLGMSRGGGGGFRGGGARMGGGMSRGMRGGGQFRGGRGWGGRHGGRGRRGWGRGLWGRGGWGPGWGGWGGGWGYPGYAVYDTYYDPCDECYGLPPRAAQQCLAVRGCTHPMLGLGQAATPASLAVQETVNRTAGLVAGTIAGGVVGLGVGIVGLGWLAYYMFVGRHKRVRSNRRRRSR
jgi:hypothetical protein